MGNSARAPERVGMVGPLGRVLAVCAFGLLWVLAAYTLGARKAGDVARETGLRQLQIIALDLEATLERYETLPYALSFQREAIQLLAGPDNGALARQVNHTLRDIQRHAKVAAVYLMDTSGKTIATSNWDTPQDYTGRNFGFRPYFLDAMNGAAGRFYGVGSTTSEPGYFIAQPVYMQAGDARPAGVMAVKISLNYLATLWQKIDEPVLLADRWGVIFMSNQPPWSYHSLERLPPAALQEMQSSLQYIGHDVMLLGALDVEPRWRGAVRQSVGRLGWDLMVYPSQKAVRRAGAVWALAAALLLALALASYWALHQRKRRLEERGLARQALQDAADDLERKIALRTGDLIQANRSIEARFSKLQETEQLLRNTQNELVQAGKLTMLGQMAAGVTHELNQPLTAIRAFADNAQRFQERGQGPRVLENLAHISAAAARMGAIIGQLKGFARKSHASVEAVGLAQSIRTSSLLLSNDFQVAGATLVLELGDEEVVVSGDSVRIEQVLINLMRNALDAAKAGEHKVVRVTLSGDDTGGCVRVADTGAGMAQHVIDRLFEPFFSTKSSGEGLGLGLAISSSIVQALNGRLTASNLSPCGAEFSLWLPLALRRGVSS